MPIIYIYNWIITLTILIETTSHILFVFYNLQQVKIGSKSTRSVLDSLLDSVGIKHEQTKNKKIITRVSLKNKTKITNKQKSFRSLINHF